MGKYLLVLLFILGTAACESETNKKPTINGTDSDSSSDSGTPGDEDGDGLPDEWELQYFGNLDQGPDDDYDGDGVSNIEEYQGRTDPTDPDDPSDDTDINVGGDCADTPWNVEIQPINLLVLLDRSLSMRADFGDKTYAAVVQEAIDDIVKQNTESGIINFALNVFPDAGLCTADFAAQDNETQHNADTDFAIRCSAASNYTGTGAAGEPTVPFASGITMDTYNAISAALGDVGLCGGTPICNTLKWADAYLSNLKTAGELTGSTFVLLATDGAPSCSTKLSTTTCTSTLGPEEPLSHSIQCLDDICSFNSAMMMAAKGFRLFLVGVGDEVQAFEQTMDVLAYYGGATKDTYIPPTTAELYNIPDPGTHFFPATSAAQVNAALEDVTNSTLSCVFEVDWDSVPERDPVLDVPVYKACDKVNIYGVPVAADAEKIAVNFAVDCASEGEEFGWNWADLPNATWKQVKAVGDDVTRCRQVRLCPKACDQLKIKGGKKIWDTATAKFGCNPIVID